ncbi:MULTISPECIES: alpha/beta fold hydrolase [Halomonadaceae]|uniref:alpha/beta fold hydrolase n=1 Tax=Halomonadaceae TaxID=28256 RepID=UPI0012F00D51|nr:MULTISPECIES: alpha/beta fold hydrolase [Halomonas]CAD5248099.1 Carboxymuconolactone decarboxylase [Halomonas sp. 156]CAD5265489.1 Carboxymuconolactone decarboxylase [Halomonas sp. 113]CAD5267562.1 Carboxymuconolactone decarboxylase [Halomonas sp. 59]CAD5280134.1 Carboxymuconolactone decarboxylase [Halomonas sp. I3]VXB62001.1 Carboxymuconolactone decarboxylase [Halomonas titanicae]
MAFHTINGRSVAYRLLGAEVNPLVVLAHPLGMSQAVWDDVIPALLPRYRVLTWDLPGHGASQAVSGEQITPADLAAEALALVELAGAQRFHFAGTSIGGVVGQQLIAEHSDRLFSVTLTNTGAVIGNPDLWNTRAGRVRQESLAAMSEEIVPRWFAPAAFEASPALKAGWCTQMGRGDDESYAQLCEMLGRDTFTGKLSGKSTKVQLFGGSEDMATPPATLEALAAELDGAPLEIFDGVGHVPAVEAPALFAQKLLAVLATDLGDVANHGVAYATGLETRKQVLGEEHVARSTANANSLDAPFQQMITRLAWGELWSNDDLTRRERSMITTGILATLGREELTLHLKTAKRIGLTEAELRQVLMHVAIYGGVPAANHAFALAKELGWGE